MTFYVMLITLCLIIDFSTFFMSSVKCSQLQSTTTITMLAMAIALKYCLEYIFKKSLLLDFSAYSVYHIDVPCWVGEI